MIGSTGFQCIAMDSKNASGQNSPCKLSLSSTRVNALTRLARSGSNSDLAIAAVAGATLNRSASGEVVLKKKPTSFQPNDARDAQDLEKLRELRKSLRRSNSPCQEGEATLVHGIGIATEEELCDRLEALKMQRVVTNWVLVGANETDDLEQRARGLPALELSESDKEVMQNGFGE